MTDRTTEEARKAFIAVANDRGYDTAHAYDTERSRWVFFNPMTADLWAFWQAALKWQAEQQKGEAPKPKIEHPAPYRCIKPHCTPNRCDGCNHAIPVTDEAKMIVTTLLDQLAFDELGLPFEEGDSIAVDKARAWLCAASPHGVPPTGWNALTDEDRERAMRSMPDMLDGFMKTWGWLHFAKAIEAICREKNDALPQAPQGEQWISVHERLPELNADNEDDGVKVYTWDGEFVTEDVFAPEYEQPAGPAVGGWLRTGDWFCSDTAARVTHWMLRRQPAPPPLAQGDSNG